MKRKDNRNEIKCQLAGLPVTSRNLARFKRVPNECAETATRAMEAGHYLMAARCWEQARRVSMGHCRRARYEVAAEKCRLLHEQSLCKAPRTGPESMLERTYPLTAQELLQLAPRMHDVLENKAQVARTITPKLRERQFELECYWEDGEFSAVLVRLSRFHEEPDSDEEWEALEQYAEKQLEAELERRQLDPISAAQWDDVMEAVRKRR